MFEPEVFRKQIYGIKESSCNIFGTFRRPLQWFGAPIVIRRPGNCAPSYYAPGGGKGVPTPFCALRRNTRKETHLTRQQPAQVPQKPNFIVILNA